MNNLPATSGARGTFRLLNAAQDMRPEDQLVSTAALFLMLTEHYGIDAQDVMTVTKNLMVHEEERIREFQAIRDYMQYELPHTANRVMYG